jgi:hypothetical protein
LPPFEPESLAERLQLPKHVHLQPLVELFGDLHLNVFAPPHPALRPRFEDPMEYLLLITSFFNFGRVDRCFMVKSC